MIITIILKLKKHKSSMLNCKDEKTDENNYVPPEIKDSKHVFYL